MFGNKRKSVRSKSARRTPPATRQRRSHSLLDWLAGVGATDIAVDLGSANTVVYVRGEGVVVREPSVLAVDRETREVVAIGAKAAALSGRVPQELVLVRPVERGVVTDFSAAAHLVHELVGRQVSGLWKRPRLVMTLAGRQSDVAAAALLGTAAALGARKAVRMPGTLAAAYGADLDKAKTAGLLVADLGAGKTDLAVVDANGLVDTEVLPLGSMDLDRAIAKIVLQETGLLLGPLTCERLKQRFCDLDEKATATSLCAGKDSQTGLPRQTEITASMLRPALVPYAHQIAQALHEVLHQTRPELSQWISLHGIMIVGGGALLRGLDRYLTQFLGVPVYLGEDPLYAVAIGAGKALLEMPLLRDSLGFENPHSA